PTDWRKRLAEYSYAAHSNQIELDYILYVGYIYLSDNIILVISLMRSYYPLSVLSPRICPRI
ncbi:MAG: hypothetical protein PVF60_13060, partial [Desulfobacterales bacterium]